MIHLLRRISSSEGRGKPIEKTGMRTVPCIQMAHFSGRPSAAQTRLCLRTREMTQPVCSPCRPSRGQCGPSGLHVLRGEANVRRTQALPVRGGNPARHLSWTPGTTSCLSPTSFKPTLGAPCFTVSPAMKPLLLLGSK